MSVKVEQAALTALKTTTQSSLRKGLEDQHASHTRVLQARQRVASLQAKLQVEQGKRTIAQGLKKQAQGPLDAIRAALAEAASKKLAPKRTKLDDLGKSLQTLWAQHGLAGTADVTARRHALEPVMAKMKSDMDAHGAVQDSAKSLVALLNAATAINSDAAECTRLQQD